MTLASECRQCRVVEVVRIILVRGSGAATRDVTQYWTPDGRLIAEEDPFPQVNLTAQVKP